MTVACQRPGCDRTWPRDPVVEVVCPSCRAGVGQWCKRPSGHRAMTPHADRDILADRMGKYGVCPSGRCGLDRTAAGAQHVLPGAERAGQRELARRLAAAPLRARADQKPCDAGLFSDAALQSDLVEQARKP